ncbi:hypothetical protein KIN20_004203 [Parelaphostrongylus tenuis]|uniref:KN17 SH3-like C-terminal domain-containing protein n=1 Tax=Parelaphostrongylus tenuis TaxID=148309 RepID=A0AAD5QEY7_PARTN|nr:hypothetical protein KIN20_004203 [Parelaphostrongylus tenuis]
MKAEKDDEERQQEMINERVRRALEQQSEVVEHRPSELLRNDDSEKIVLNLNLDRKPTLEDLNRPMCSSVSVFDQIKTKKEEVEDDAEASDSRREHQKREYSRHDRHDHHTSKNREARSRSKSRDRKRRMNSPRGSKERPISRKEEKPRKSALDEIREQEERFKEKKNRKDHWLHEGIIVKVVTKKLGEDYYKSKGVVIALIDDYVASVKLDDGVLVKLDQSHVETVIPSVGREMKVVNGAYRGCIAKLESIDTDNFSLNLRITEGPMNGRKISVPYEDASKLA